ncbi:MULTISPECIES: FAD-binding oxidoreductase [unclassified Rathayibacter]|uniref:NAD(P)/FAD-dependent oxidoreductase n=1 Tax=unclassified Rathayibacter TaxID=2609250 RepID=UPI000CE86A9E|nr:MULTISPECIES: FAD-binding oxidoreductase [unclassified Rathayibacter]PPF28445.1 D-amino-acid oxidase [Rathayibacter sp. AY1F2]PPH48345.1 D-amino-acid oxidase [Rathayibacter sp. AY1F7]QHF21635.1 FAD-dependent oxidoreductase [Rathayibacter sp. VKM Ac-2762]
MPRTTASAPAVVVIGAGVLGVSTAAQLARRGATVTLVTETTVSSGASGRSLSWLNSAGIRSDEYHALRVAGIDRYRTLLARNPDAARFLRFDGGLTWAKPGRSHRERSAHEKAVGYDSEWLSPDEIAEWTPGVDPSSVAEEGAIFNPGEGWVDLPLLTAHLLQAFQEAGGVLIENAGRTTVVVEGGRAVGAETASGDRIPADEVVLATGPWVPRELAELGIHLPEQTPISLLVTTKPIEVELRAVLNTPRVAVRPTPHGTLVLDSGWSEREVVVDPDGTWHVRDETVATLLEEASAVLAGNPRLELDSFGAGPKPIPGDGEPVLGAVEEIPGLHAVFTHSGATLGLIVGELIALEILSGEPSPLLRPFRSSRFSAVTA